MPYANDIQVVGSRLEKGVISFIEEVKEKLGLFGRKFLLEVVHGRRNLKVRYRAKSKAIGMTSQSKPTREFTGVELGIVPRPWHKFFGDGAGDVVVDGVGCAFGGHLHLAYLGHVDDPDFCPALLVF